MRSVMDIIGQVRQLTEDGSLKWDQGLMSTTFDVKISDLFLQHGRGQTKTTERSRRVGAFLSSLHLRRPIERPLRYQYSPKYDELYSFYKAARRNALNVNSQI